MDRLPNEVLQLILNEIAKPFAFAKLNKRLRNFTSDAYVRARYFLSRHGKSQALFYALGRGDIVTERVIEILLSCGAHVSRHLIQLAVQHYHHGHVSFISRPWVRDLPFVVFMRFLALASVRFDGEFKLPTKKDPDDGTKFQFWIAERKRKVGSDKEKEARQVVEELIERWKFQPVCDKDPALAHFAITLAVEPKLLALAVANGYDVDPVYRDYIFRRLLVRPSEGSRLADSARKDELLSTLRDICKSRDSSLFLSRTVAAEICLEAKANKVAYDVLKTLDRDDLLRFSLITLVQDLIKTFATKRFITDSDTIAAIHYLFCDLPVDAANDPGVRHVVLLTVFSTSLTAHIANARLLKLGLVPDPNDAVGIRQVYKVAPTLAPISRAELVDVLLNPHIRSHYAVATYVRFYGFYPNDVVDSMLEEVALCCLKLPSKGEMLEALTRRYTGLRHIIASAIETYAFTLDDLPPSDALDDVKRRFRVALAREDGASVTADETSLIWQSYLGDLTHETLSESFARDIIEEPQSTGWLGYRYRRRRAGHGPHLERKKDDVPVTKTVPDNDSKAPLSTVRWVVDAFGSMSAQAAVFADHVVANWLDEHKSSYYGIGHEPATKGVGTLEGVPITMKHWEILARLGRQPSSRMMERVMLGETFCKSAEDYLAPAVHIAALEPETEAPVDSREETPAAEVRVEPPPVEAPVPSASSRPRRAAAEKIKSYVEPSESDEEGVSSDLKVAEEVAVTAVAAVGVVADQYIQVKADSVESMFAPSVGEDDADCDSDCPYDCHRDWSDESDAEDEGIPIESCALGLDCPERHTLFAAPEDRRAALELAKNMRVEAEETRCATTADKSERARKDTLEADFNALSERISKADSRTANTRRTLVCHEWEEQELHRFSAGVPTEGTSRRIDNFRGLIQKGKEQIKQFAVEEQRLREEMDKLRPEAVKQEDEEQLSLWVTALSALHKEEMKKAAETKKRLALKRISKSSFVQVLDWRLYSWRATIREQKQKRKQEEEVQLKNGDEEDNGERKKKRHKHSGSS